MVLSSGSLGPRAHPSQFRERHSFAAHGQRGSHDEEAGCLSHRERDLVCREVRGGLGGTVRAKPGWSSPPPNSKKTQDRICGLLQFFCFSSYAQGTEDGTRIHGESSTTDLDGPKAPLTCRSMTGQLLYKCIQSEAPNQSFPAHTGHGTRPSPPPRVLNPADSPTAQAELSRCQRWAQALKMRVRIT